MKRVLIWTGLIIASPILAVVLVAYIIAYLAYWCTKGTLIKVAFLFKHGPFAKKGILIYSNGTIWREYIDEQWLPTLGDTIVALNWSERAVYSKQPTLEWRAFQHWASTNEFNPIVIIFHGIMPVQLLRFHKAFLDHKHGNSSRLLQLEGKLFRQLGKEKCA
jgi:hypothetical protein